MKCRLGFGQVKCPVLELNVYRVVMVFVFLAVVVRGNPRVAAIRIDGCLELFVMDVLFFLQCQLWSQFGF